VENTTPALLFFKPFSILYAVRLFYDNPVLERIEDSLPLPCGEGKRVVKVPPLLKKGRHLPQ